MNLAVYTLAELPQLLEKNFFKKSKSIPISQQRADSHFKNPRADLNDKVLWCLSDKDQLIAYRLMMPDHIYINDKKVKMAWVSCLWVDPKHRGKGYGKKVTLPALDAWDQRVMGTNFAPASLALYKSLGGLYPFSIINGLRLHYQSKAADLLGNRNQFFKTIKPVFKLGDLLLNKLKKSPAQHPLKGQGINIQIIPAFDQESYDFLKPYSINEYFRRSQKELDWAMSTPWIIQREKPSVDDHRFHFSSQAKIFSQLVHKISYQGKLRAVIMSSLVNDHLMIPYAYFDKAFTSKVAKYIENFVLEDEIALLTIFDKNLVDYFQNTANKAIHAKKFVKRFMAFEGIPKPTKSNALKLQAGDGDGVFT